jgi:DNA-binding response OmpR family regulator
LALTGGVVLQFHIPGRKSTVSRSQNANGRQTAEEKPEPVKIAIVEDERLVAENLKEILEENNYKVVAMAASGKEAVEAIVSANPDLVLMDIRLKGDIDGIQTAIILQQAWKERFPIIFLTAHSQKQFPHLSSINSAFLYLTKPYSQQQLLSAIEKMIEN